MHQFHPSILREYDIRGIIGETLSAEDAYAIGRAFASFLPEWQGKRPRIAVGRDGRLSSPALEEALVRGLSESGAEAVRIGVGPTPMLYYAVCAHTLDGGIMVTGSHNPPSHNGFKFMLGRKAFYGADIARLGVMAAKGDVFAATGEVTTLAVEPEYTAMLAKTWDGKKALRVVWDAGNGATGQVLTDLIKQLPGTHFPLYAEIDGNFPNHHPDPSEPHNLEALIAKVRQEKCDLGIAFDGDGDRIGAVDETGEIIWGDQLLALLARDVIAANPKATIIADVKASKTLFDEIARLGGTPLMWKTGHSLIKTKMAETGALLAGEMSGHMFFADKYYGYDDGMYAAMRLLNFVSHGGQPLSELRAGLPKMQATPEIRFACDDVRKFKVIDEVKARLTEAGADFSAIDGVRVNAPDGWWLLRASNTQAVLVARAESATPEGLKRLQSDLNDALAASGVEIAA